MTKAVRQAILLIHDIQTKTHTHSDAHIHTRLDIWRTEKIRGKKTVKTYLPVSPVILLTDPAGERMTLVSFGLFCCIGG